MAEKLAVLAVLAIAACGPSPRPVTPTVESGWPTVLGNARRAPFENEVVPDSLEVLWDIDAGSGLRGSLLVTDSILFTATTNRQLFAFGTRTGRRYWDQRLEGEIAGDIVRSGRTLFMTTAEWNGRVHARDMERGKKVWRHDVGPTRYSPLLEGGIVYVATDAGRVYALRSENGEQIWRTNLRAGSANTPLSAGDALIVATNTDTIYRIAKQDGRLLARGHIDRSLSAPPALAGDTLVVATHAGSVIGVDARTLQPLWRVETGAPVLAAPIVGRDGTIHVLNRDAQIWRIQHGAGTRVAGLAGGATSAFTLARDRYVIGLVDGTLLVTDMNGKVLAEHKFNDTVSAPVAVRGRALYVPLLHGRIVKLGVA